MFDIFCLKIICSSKDLNDKHFCELCICDETEHFCEFVLKHISVKSVHVEMLVLIIEYGIVVANYRIIVVAYYRIL